MIQDRISILKAIVAAEREAEEIDTVAFARLKMNHRSTGRCCTFLVENDDPLVLSDTILREATLCGLQDSMPDRVLQQESQRESKREEVAIKDLIDVEKVIKRTIMLKDIARGDIYTSGKYSAQRKIIAAEIIVQNDHAWPQNPYLPP
ncbi:hypothetical protein CHS0354_042641 [Potamilus streckersoni]|uniref:Uncharacterized protein n=1 Tax=Potamilus streckersoni TaxID=2493646 RepID=A0AAE0WBZ8_9BIVA|nr:hypothetical protein CHS0354_042641 [Potamilus streckersoni]